MQESFLEQKVFLNQSLKPYNALTREEKHILLDAMIDGNCERYYEDGWFETKEFDERTHRVYRTKPKEYKKLDIPWQVIDEKWKYAVIDEDGENWLFEEKPVWDVHNKMWTNVIGVGGDFTTLIAFKLDTTGIVAEHSLTQRPDGV